MPSEDPLAFRDATHAKLITNVLGLNAAIASLPATGTGAASEKTATEELAVDDALKVLSEDDAVIEAISSIPLILSGVEVPVMSKVEVSVVGNVEVPCVELAWPKSC